MRVVDQPTSCGLSRKAIASLILAVVLFLLVSAVIGLAVTTGIMVRRAGDAEARLAEMSVSLAPAVASCPAVGLTA